jgi:hypothetical protein
MYEFSKGLSDTVKGGLLATLGSLLELAPRAFAGSHGAFDAQWLLQQAGGLVRSKATPAPLRAGALAGLNSALCIEVTLLSLRGQRRCSALCYLPGHVNIHYHQRG